MVCGGFTNAIEFPFHYDTTFDPDPYISIQRCYRVSKITKKWEKIISLRGYHTSNFATVQWDDETIWLVGGFNGYGYSQSAYFLTASGLFEDRDPLRQIPEEMSNHCMVKIDDNTFVKIGTDKAMHDTWIYNHGEGWSGGPSIFNAHWEFFDVRCGKIMTGKYLDNFCLLFFNAINQLICGLSH